MTKYLSVACALLLLPAVSQAATINLNLENLDVVYNGAANLLHDINSESNADGGTKVASKADKLTGSTFTLDGDVKDQRMAGDDIYGDLRIENLPGSIAAPDLDGVPVTFAIGDNDFSFGFDWFLQQGGSTVSSLGLNFDRAVVTLTDNAGGAPSLTVTAATTDWTQDNLPAGLEFEPGTLIKFTYTSNNTAAAPVNGADYTNIFGMEGVVNISGESVIPEPAAGFMLLGSLACAAAVTRWRLG